MTAINRLSLAGLVALLLVTASASAADDPFQRIRKLEGTWFVVNDKGETLDQISSVFHITSNGHTVIETMFPGTQHEMVNVYYRDVDNVLMTHHCAGGNQPILRLVATAKPEVIAMEFQDITNMQTMDDEHMHEGQMQLLGDNRMKVEWRTFKRGRFTDATRFEMVRKP